MARRVLDDHQLVAAWASGDDDAARRFYDRYFDGLARYFTGKIDDAAELIQRTFTACLRSRDKLSKATSVRAYLFTIARHELLAELRKRRPHDPLDSRVQSLRDLGTSPSSAVAREEERELLVASMQQIPLDLQTALELHYWEQLSTRELADVLEIPAGTVKSRLFRARELLRDELRRVSPDGVALDRMLRALE